MAQPTLPIDKTIRIPVRLVTMAGDELPFKGFMLVPEDRLVLLENVATAARVVVERNRDAGQDASKGLRVQTAVKILDERLSELEKVWDIPRQ